VRNTLLVPNVPIAEGADPRKAVSRLLGVSPSRLEDVRLVRRSLDARHGVQRWRGVYRVTLEGAPRHEPPGLRAWTDKDDVRYGLTDGAAPERAVVAPDRRVLVVGAGPAGLFAALWLAEAGVPVTLFERGSAVHDRVDEVNGHWRRKRPLDPESNTVFGEGGAGTFSDGKIYTRRRDGEIGYVLRRFVDFGARADILEEGWAHLGTDKVRAVLPVFRARLRELGVDVRFRTRVDDVIVEGGRVVGVVLADGSEVRGAAVLVAPGHSARDTVRRLVERGAAAEARPIAVGARIEHPQSVIDRARYGLDERGDLPAASYRLAWHPASGPKARTFCMCPGGMIVPAAPDPGRVVVNGMSFAAQRSFWANAAIIVEVEPAIFGGTGPCAGYAWQDAIERAAFAQGGGDETAPAQRAVDLLSGRASGSLPDTSYPLGVRPADLRDVLPGIVVEGMHAAVRDFDRKLPGFLHPEALLVAPETRTTSPVRLLRDVNGQSTTLPGLFPMGEGAGYGGGIVSCALDGLRVARGVHAVLGIAA
jgi:uncharacterized FAD-dependent dehydrogenase